MTVTPSAKDVSGHAAVHQEVQSQFGAAAAAYTTSPAHDDRDALARVVELTRPNPGDVALDIATGAGHTALALAAHVARVIAFDLTEEMLAETRRNAAARGLTNIRTRQGAAENLPFPDASFDIVTVRQAPHHFADVQSAIREMARVAKPGARIVIVDSTSPEDPALRSQWNRIEKLRDSSHVQNYTPSQWRAMLAGADSLRICFEEVGLTTENGRGMDFTAWTRRINTPPKAVKEVRRMFCGATPALAHALRIQVDGDAISFCVPTITIAALKE